MATFLVLTGERQCALGEGVCRLHTVGQQMRLPQGETTERLIDYHFRCSRLFQRLREQRHGVGDASAQGVRRPKSAAIQGK